MRRQLLLILAFVLLNATRLPAQTSNGPLLPDRLGSFVSSKPGQVWKPGSHDPYPGVIAFPQPVMVEAGFVDLEARFYGGVEVAIFKFRDPSGAYSATTYRPAMSQKDLLPVQKLQAQESCDCPIVKTEVQKEQVGNFIVAVAADPSNHDSAKSLLKLVLPTVSKIEDRTPLPPIRAYLPDANRATGTERYALGPVAFREAAASLERAEAATLVDMAGFDSGAEAMFAKYKAVKDEAILLLIEYPTPQLAEMHLRHLQRALHDAKLSTSSIERKGSLLSIVLATTSAEYAEKLRAAINYETEVTWNEPSTTATDPPITSTLVKIIIATMVLMGMAFVLGLAFGGVRVITKRLFPGKVFDRPAQMEVLQLGLSGKPIDPRDMY
jgi:hypothetical protein